MGALNINIEAVNPDCLKVTFTDTGAYCTLTWVRNADRAMVITRWYTSRSEAEQECINRIIAVAVVKMGATVARPRTQDAETAKRFLYGGDNVN